MNNSKSAYEMLPNQAYGTNFGLPNSIQQQHQSVMRKNHKMAGGSRSVANRYSGINDSNSGLRRASPNSIYNGTLLKHNSGAVH